MTGLCFSCKVHLFQPEKVTSSLSVFTTQPMPLYLVEWLICVSGVVQGSSVDLQYMGYLLDHVLGAHFFQHENRIMLSVAIWEKLEYCRSGEADKVLVLFTSTESSDGEVKAVNDQTHL